MSQYFRAGVGAVIVNSAGLVLALERADTAGAWQFPQGGIDDGEEPADAVYREVHEETGITPNSLCLLRPYPQLLSYELPPEWRSPKVGRGQTQQWYLFRYLDAPDSITLPVPGEFRRWRWMTFDELLTLTAPFRLPLYQNLAREFTDIATVPRGVSP